MQKSCTWRITFLCSEFAITRTSYMYVIAVKTHLAVLRVSTAATTAAHKHTTQPACRVSLSVYQIVNLIYQLSNLLQSKVIKSPSTCKETSSKDLDGRWWVGEDDIDSWFHSECNWWFDVNATGNDNRTLKKRPCGVNLAKKEIWLKFDETFRLWNSVFASE